MWHRAEKVFLINESAATGYQVHTVVLKLWGYGKASFTPRIYRPMLYTAMPDFSKFIIILRIRECEVVTAVLLLTSIL